MTSNFSFCHSVFTRLVQQTCKNKGLFGKKVKEKCELLYIDSCYVKRGLLPLQRKSSACKGRYFEFYTLQKAILHPNILDMMDCMDLKFHDDFLIIMHQGHVLTLYTESRVFNDPEKEAF